MNYTIKSIGLNGMNAFSVDVEIDAHRGLEQFDIIGLAEKSVKESAERIKSAFRSTGISFPNNSMIINLAPADVKKAGTYFDLAISAAVLAAMGRISDDNCSDCAFLGELSLGGELRGVNGVLPMAIYAYKTGIKRLFVPYDNAHEASVVKGLEVYGAHNLKELLDHLSGHKLIKKMPPYVPEPGKYTDTTLDMKDVKGQKFAKRALEVAACGGHNVIMIGAPGSGKSMLAKRIPSILPTMTFEESIETTNVYSIAGLINKDSPLVTCRPFRAPHHTVSTAGLSGGGSVPKPGEISLAHNGLLFLDELAEFSRSTLEVLRQPLEDQKVSISRSSGTVTYPCDIMLVAAMNPCPCGYYGHPTKKCICTKKQVAQYLSKISGPLLDRFDLHIEVAPVEYESLSSRKDEEASEVIRERVQRAREIQNERFKGTNISCNARITPDILRDVCVMTDSASELLRDVFDRLGLSARAYDKILKVARTIADMGGKKEIDREHVSQAVRYRTLDRKFWANE